MAKRMAMCSASFRRVGLSEESEGACAARAESAWLTVKRARRGRVESLDWKGCESSFCSEPSLVRAICASICMMPFSSSSCRVIRPVSTAIEPAPARAERLARIPAVALPQRLGLPTSELSLTASAKFHPRGLALPPAGPEPLPLPEPGPLPRPLPWPRPEPLPGPRPEPLAEPAPGPTPEPGPPPGPCTAEISLSALLLPEREPGPEAASVAASLLNQNPGVSGARGVPPPLPPTIFQVLGPEPTPATLPPSEPLPEPCPGSAEPATPLLSQKPGASGARGVPPVPLPPTMFQVLGADPPPGFPDSDAEPGAWLGSLAPAT